MIKTKSLEILRKYQNLNNLINFAEKKSQELNLVPLLSFYFEDKLLKNLIKSLDGKFSEYYKELKWSRDIFINKVSSEERQEAYHYFSYYAFPISDSFKITIVENNWLPVKAKLVDGTFRLTFQFYNDLQELNRTIEKQDEDDVVIEVSNSRVVSVKSKRNIFMEKRAVDISLSSKLPLVTNIIMQRELLLISGILANNVYPFNNEVEFEKGDVSKFSGKAPEDDVINGNTLRLKTKAEIYYDYKTKKLEKEKEVLLEAYVHKLS